MAKTPFPYRIATPHNPRQVQFLPPRIIRKLRWARKQHQIKTVLKEISDVKINQNNVLKNNMELFNTLTQNVDIYIPHTLPAKEWIEAFQQQAIEYRAYLLQATLHGMAIMEGARQASKNLTDDYGFAVSMDFTDIANVAKQVANIDLLSKLLSKTTLTPAMRNKALEFAVSSSFGPDKHKNAMADMMRNLSVPEQSPFGASGLIRMSDPNMQSKIRQFTGEAPLQPGSVAQNKAMVKLSRGIDKITEDMRKDRQERLRNR